MARRSLSKEEIKKGMDFFYSKFNGENPMSSRDMLKIKDLPFSLTTYYKYLPKYEKNLKKSGNNEEIKVAPDKIIDNELTPTKAIARNKTKALEVENEALMKENALLTKFIVKKFIAKEMGAENENNNTNSGIH